MQRGGRYLNSIELLQGTLDLIILQTLRRGPQHGYGLSQAINAHSREAFKVETGSLYPALHRLERRGWVSSAWKSSANKQRAKFYRLTPAGRRQLTAEHSRWARFVAAMAAVLTPGPREA